MTEGLGRNGLVPATLRKFSSGTKGIHTLAGPAVYTAWHITGDAGDPNFVRFSGVTNLRGAANNRDTFHLGARGNIAISAHARTKSA